MTPDEMKEHIAEMDDTVLYADGFEDALIGYVEVFNNIVAVYDRAKCLDILMTRDGMEYDEAEEFFSFNVTGSYVGPKTPAFLTDLKAVEP